MTQRNIVINEYSIILVSILINTLIYIKTIEIIDLIWFPTDPI